MGPCVKTSKLHIINGLMQPLPPPEHKQIKRLCDLSDPDTHSRIAQSRIAQSAVTGEWRMAVGEGHCVPCVLLWALAAMC